MINKTKLCKFFSLILWNKNFLLIIIYNWNKFTLSIMNKNKIVMNKKILKYINKNILRIFLPFLLQKSSFLQMWIKKKKTNINIIFLQDQGEFDWSPTIQSAISGSFYWCYILSQVVGGVLTQYFGTKAVFGGSQLITAICSLLMPSAAGIHYGFMIALRSIQGVASVSILHIKKKKKKE